jgi:hypothetical protein
MSAQLGETQDPTALVPGNPAAVGAAIQRLCRYRDVLHQAGSGLSRIGAGGWTGEAADAFRARFEGQPAEWVKAGDCFGNAATALDDYVPVLVWAQAQATQAIAAWNQGVAATDQAWTQHQQAAQQSGQPVPFVDPGAAQRASAESILENARRQLQQVGDQAARTVGTARDAAPEKPGFWSAVGDLGRSVLDGAANLGGELINGLASFGNAMVNHPGDVVTTAAGVAMMAAGTAGEFGGAVLDLSVVGAPAGVAINVGSAAVIAGGATVATAGLSHLMMNAAGDDSVHPASTDHGATGGGEYEPVEGFRGSDFSRDEIEEFVNGHTGDSMPGMNRPTPQQVKQVLDDAQPVRLRNADGTERNAEEFVATVNGDRIRVIVNYDMPWKSTSYKIGQ